MGKVYFPQFKKGKEGLDIELNRTLLEHIRKAGLFINAECSGKGTCGKCIVQIQKGIENLSRISEQEKKFSLDKNERLACIAKITSDASDIFINIKDYGPYKILGISKTKGIKILPEIIKKENKLYDSENNFIGNYQGKIYGLAVDVGTTTVVFEIVDLETGNTLWHRSFLNPQIAYGNDVISRIEWTLVDKIKNEYIDKNTSREKLSDLQKCIIKKINSELSNLNEIYGENISENIYYTVISGNSAMRNIFFGIDISSLGVLPFEPEAPGHILKKAKELKLKIYPDGYVYGPILFGGHLGADTTSNIIASEIYRDKNISMLVDIGTNCEIIVGNSKKILCASYPAGGAFEGSGISCGIGAVSGAIVGINITNGKIIFNTIDEKNPAGICGSGLIDLVSELLKNKIITKNAKLSNDFFITSEIKFTQHDLNQFITAKAGLRAYIDLLLKYYGINYDEIEKLYLSGAFGNYINVENAIKIGVLPEIDIKKVIKIGNGSLSGAKEILLNRETRKISEKLKEIVQHIKPVESEKDFIYYMSERMYFN